MWLYAAKLPVYPSPFQLFWTRRALWPTPPFTKPHLTFLYVRNGTLQMLLRYDLSDNNQQVEFAVIKVLRGARGCQRRPGVALAA